MSAGTDLGLHRDPSRMPEPDRIIGIDRMREAATLAWPFQVLLLAALWIAVHPYLGLIHDARLYLIQAINDIHHNLQKDTFFANGSQGEFTLFSLPYQLLVRQFGPFQAMFAVFVGGQLAWFASLIYFTQSLFGRGQQSALASLGIILLYPFYDGTGTFRYGEPFATPRLFAEAFTLLALALCYRGRTKSAAFPLAAACVLHPIMALPGAAIVALLAALQYRRLWLFYGIALLAVVVSGGLGFAPFARLFARFDPVWFKIVYQRCNVAFLTDWHWFGFITPVSDAGILTAAWMIAGTAERRFIAAVSTVAAGGVVISLLGGDFLRDVLIVNLQFARVLWVVAVLSNGWAAVLALRLPRGCVSRHLVLVALAAQALATAVQAITPFLALIFVVAAACLAWEKRTGAPLSARLRLVAWLFAVPPLLLTAGLIYYVALPSRAALPEFWQFLLGFAVALTASAILALSLLGRIRPSPLFAWVAALLVLGGLAAADRRDDWERFIETPNVPATLAGFVDGYNNIYWEDGLELLWFKLDRPDYYSCLQGTGTMFFRGTAMEYERRSSGLAGLDTADFDDLGSFSPCPRKHDPKERGPKNPAQLAAACRALPDLDAMVLMERVPGTDPAVWHAPAAEIVLRHNRPVQITTFYRYRCADFR